MNKLSLIIKREFLAKVRNKSFVVMTILSPLLVVALGALVFFLNQKNSEDIRKIAFIDESHLLTNVFKDSKTIKYINVTDKGLQKAQQETKDFYFGLIYIPNTTTLNDLSKNITFYSDEAPGMGMLRGIEEKIGTQIQHLKMKEMNVDFEVINKTKTQVNIITENFEGDKSSKIGGILRMFAGGGFGYLIFMFIIIYGTSVMRSVIEEKTSRIIEVIISSVKPFQLMLGKILGNAFAGILQFLIWMIIGGFLMFITSSLFGVDTSTTAQAVHPEAVQQIQKASSEVNLIQEILLEMKKLPIMTIFFSFLIYFFGGYLIYSSIYAAIGAAVDNETDTQQFMTPVLLPLIVAIYIGFSVIENPNGSIAVGFSLFPLTSPIVMLMRIPFGVPWWEIALSMVLLLLTFLGIVWFAAKIYRIGILMYGKKPTYKELVRWLKY